MKCINFDLEFERYMKNWMKAHEKEYKNVDAMEDAMHGVYEAFLDTPADFLSGAKPGEYFLSYTKAKPLVNWMEDYFKQRVPVPDMLLNRISDLGMEAEEPLMQLLQKEHTSPEARMCAVTLLREIDSITPAALYTKWQKERQEEDEMADNALESLESMGEKAYPLMREAIEEATPAGQEALLSLLCNGPCDDGLFDLAMKLLKTQPEKIAVLADYVSKLGDERALPVLKKMAGSEETGYLDYIELRSAIEKLGGDAPERTFDAADPAYEALHGLQ